MSQNKQPIIQSVFDRRLLQKDQLFFLKALQEIELYHGKVVGIGRSSSALKKQADVNVAVTTAYDEVQIGLEAAHGLLLGVHNGFDVLSDDSIY